MILPLKPGITNVPVAVVVGDPPVNCTFGYEPAKYPEPEDVMLPAID